MNNSVSTVRWGVACLLALWLAGCGDSPPPPARVPVSSADSEPKRSSSRKQITIYVAGMNQRLKVM